MMNLETFFKQYPRAAVAFSGGVDSSYLLYAASQYAAEYKAYYVKSAFQPQFELEDAERFCRERGIPLKVLKVDILSCREVTENPPDRCYHCKKQVFSTILAAAEADGFSVLLDGTNASDDEGDRPGTRALKEMSVLSPLRICGLTKDRIRLLSRQARLFTWDKPAYACLATRIPTGEEITGENLFATEVSENFLFHLGFTDFRVRRRADAALIQVRSEQMEKILDHREEITEALKKYYAAVTLDLVSR